MRRDIAVKVTMNWLRIYIEHAYVPFQQNIASFQPLFISILICPSLNFKVLYISTDLEKCHPEGIEHRTGRRYPELELGQAAGKRPKLFAFLHRQSGAFGVRIHLFG